MGYFRNEKKEKQITLMYFFCHSLAYNKTEKFLVLNSETRTHRSHMRLSMEYPKLARTFSSSLQDPYVNGILFIQRLYM